MPSGHTDRNSINDRRPMTAGMVDILRRLRGFSLRDCHFARSEKSQLRALMDRGLVEVSPDGLWSITKSGEGMIIDDRRPPPPAR